MYFDNHQANQYFTAMQPNTDLIIEAAMPRIQAALSIPRGGLPPLDRFVPVDQLDSLLNRKAAPASVPAVECAIWVKSNLLTMLPRFVGRRNVETNTYEQVVDHPVNHLLQRPSIYLQPFVLWEWLFSSLVAQGNAYAIIRRDLGTNTPIEIIPAVWSETNWVGNPMRPNRRGRRRPRLTHQLAPLYEGTSNDPRRYDDLDAITLHGHGFSPSSMSSPSPIRGHAAEIIDTLIAGIQRTQTIMREGGSTGKVVEFLPEMEYDLDLILQIRQDLQEHLSGIKMAAGLPVLPMGTKMSTSSLSAVDMELIETLKFSIEDIARIFNLPPRCIYHYHAGMRTGDSVEDQGTDTERYSLRPEAERIASSLTAKLLTPAEQLDGLCVCMPTDSIAMGTFSDMLSALGPAVSNFGILTPNEARHHMGLEPMPGGEELRAPRGGPAEPGIDSAGESA